MYDMINRGEFPPPIKISERGRRWLKSEFDDWKRKVIERSLAERKTNYSKGEAA